MDELVRYSHVPIVLIHKENITSPAIKNPPRDYTLNKVAFIVPMETPDKYTIHCPSNSEVSDCTLIHISKLYLNSNDYQDMKTIEFNGNLISLLEKHKTTDDVQIFFFAMIKVNLRLLETSEKFHRKMKLMNIWILKQRFL